MISDLKNCFKKRLLIFLPVGFFSGLPLLLTSATLGTWLADLGVNKTTIGLFALVGMPYALKFLWAPLLDIKILKSAVDSLVSSMPDLRTKVRISFTGGEPCVHPKFLELLEYARPKSSWT